jgi:hypothetical protein
MGNHLPDRAGVPACETDSNTSREGESNATSHAGSPVVEVEIYYCAGSCKSIVLERTIDRQQGQSNPNTTIKHIKLTIMHSIIKGPSFDSLDCYF